MTPEIERYIHAWLEIAENDLASAKRLIDIEPYILDTACFHCQQSVEKDLKALLVTKGIEPERTHSISYLLEQCGKFDNIFTSIDPKRLDTFAVLIRYPHSAELPTTEETNELFALAKSIKGIVLERIGKVINLNVSASELLNKNSKKLLTKKVKSENPLLPEKKNSESLLPKKRMGKSKGQGL